MGKIFKDCLRMKDGVFIVAKSKASGEVVTDVAEMESLRREGEIVSEAISTTDTVEFFREGINDFFLRENPDADRQWEQLFAVQGSTKSGELFPLRERTLAGGGSHGIVFKEVGELGEIKYSTVQSDEAFVRNVKYATALGYSTEWFEDGNIGAIEMATEDFRRAADDKMALIHYNIILNAISSGVSKSAAVGGTTLDDFITAINSAVAIMRRNKYEPNFILAAPEQEDIVEQALHDVYRDRQLTDSAKRLTHVNTEYFPAGTVALVRGRDRLVSLDRKRLTLGNFSDLLHDAETLVGLFRRGAAMLDGRCCRGITGL